jgi:hypothetical protein
MEPNWQLEDSWRAACVQLLRPHHQVIAQGRAVILDGFAWEIIKDDSLSQRNGR